MIDFTKNLKITLDEIINQLELISIVASEKADTGIIAWFNNNEGFVAFLGVIASFVVSVTAIVISVLTYRSQKKEQTKNAQESAKLQRELEEKNAKLQMELEEKNANLQRELTEQSNKLQEDLQKRQIKLDKFNITTEQIYYIIVVIAFIEKLRIMFLNCNFTKKSCEDIYKGFDVSYDCDISIQNLTIELYKTRYLLSKDYIKEFEKSLKTLSDIINSFAYIGSIANSKYTEEEKEKLFLIHFEISKDNFYKNLMIVLEELKKEFLFYQEELEKDNNINNI